MKTLYKHTDVAKQKISKATKGKTYEERYGRAKALLIRKKMSISQKGRKINLETKKLLSNINKKYSNEDILHGLENLFNINPNLKKSDLYGAGKFKGVICHESCIRNRFGSLDKAAEYIGKEFSKQRKWQLKEKFVGDILKIIYPDVVYHQYHPNIGWPDYEIDTTIFEVKSTFNDIKENQIEKYKSIRKDIKIVPFTEIGKRINNISFISVESLISQLSKDIQQNFIIKLQELRQ